MGLSMKKLKLLHLNTTSPTGTTPTPDRKIDQPPILHPKLPATPPSSSSPNSKPKKYYPSRIPVAAGNPSPPISPSSSSVSNSPPKQSNSSHHSHQKHRSEMLRSARNAFHNFQHHHHHQQSAAAAAVVSHQQPPVTGRLGHQTETSYPPQQQQQQQKRQSVLPTSGFLVLTSEDSHSAICIPSSPVQQTRNATSSYLLPPIPINAPIQQLASQATTARPPQAPARSSRRKPPPLTQNAVQMIVQDTRVARWQRVLGYVKEQRKLVISERAEERRLSGQKDSIVENLFEEGTPWAKYIYGWTDSSMPDNTLNKNGNTNGGYLDEAYAIIERKNKLLETLDKDEDIAARSLWSGGSAGTNGVDEFVWDDDEEGYVGDDAMELDKEAVEEKYMRDEEANRRRYSKPQEVQDQPQPQTQPQPAQATPPQLKDYTFFLRDRRFFDYQRQARQSTSANTRRPTTSPNQSRNAPGGSNSPSPSSPGYKRQAIGHGIIGQRTHGKTGSFGSSSIEGAIFKMDAERPQTSYPSVVMEVDSSSNIPLPSSFFRTQPTTARNRSSTSTSNGSGSKANNNMTTRRATYPPVKISTSGTGTSYPYGAGAGYLSPTLASMRKASVPTNVIPHTPKLTNAAVGSGAMDKGLREYVEALRRYEVRCVTPSVQTVENRVQA